MIKQKDIEKLLCQYQEEELISNIDYSHNDDDNWVYTFRYKKKNGYIFSFEKGYMESEDDNQYYVGFYNYDDDKDRLSACIGAEFVESDNNPQMDKSFSKRINLIEKINKLIKQFQLEHVFERE